MNRQSKPVYSFGLYRLDTAERQLLREGRRVSLTPRLLDLLEALVGSCGHLIDKTELMRRVWAGTAVEQNNLTVSMCALRKALGDNPEQPRYIETVPRRGYRFLAPVEEARVSAPGGAAAPADDACPSEPFVGREPELRRLDELLERTLRGKGCVAFITGEPGIGKTTLAEQFIRRARSRFPSLLICSGRCLEHYGTGEAYLPFFDSLGSLFGENGGAAADAFRLHAPTWCLQFPGRFGSPEAMESLKRETLGANKDRMLREMVEALSALGSGTAMVLILEDLHWADPSSIDLLRYLSSRISKLPLLVLGTFRSDEIESGANGLKTFKLEMEAHNSWVECTPGLLSGLELTRFLNARFHPNDFPAEVGKLIHLKTEGQPLFATSLIRFLVENGDLGVRDGGIWSLVRPLPEVALTTPENVRSMIRRKIEAIGEGERRVLYYASIGGEEFHTAVLADMLGADEVRLEEQLIRLSRVHRLLEDLGEEELPDGSVSVRYRFCHALYREFLYQELGRGRRASLHRQAGDALVRRYGDQSRGIAAQLAIHFERGRDFQRALDWLLEAGDNAARLHAGVEAEDCYSRALALVDRLPIEARARACAKIYQKRGTANFAQGKLDAADADFGRMLEHARDTGDMRREHAALIALGRVSFFRRRLQDVAVKAGEARSAAERLGDEALASEALALKAISCVALGRLRQAREMLDESIQSARRLQHGPALMVGTAWRGLLHYFHTEYRQAEEALQEALEFSTAALDEFMVRFCLFFLGLTRANQGRISDALEALRQVEDLAHRNGDTTQSSKVHNCIGWIYREIGALPEAIDRNNVGLEHARGAGLVEAEVNSAINLVHDYARLGRHDQSCRAIEDARRLLKRDDWLRWRFAMRLEAGRAQHWLSLGKAGQAEGCARGLLARAARYSARKYAAAARHILGQVEASRGNHQEGLRHLSRALQELRSRPAPLLEWKIHALRARVLSNLGELTAAAESKQKAVGIIEQIASTIRDPHLRDRALAYLSAAL